MNPLRLKVIEIVGLHKGEHGRTCGIHPECGRAISVGSTLILRWEMITISEVVKELRDIVAEEPLVVTKKRGRKKKLPKELVEVVKIRQEPTVKARIWNNGIESCLVGFVSRAFIAAHQRTLNGRVVEITEILSESMHESEKSRSVNANGLARGTIIA
jgi:hypothetical protein